MNNRPRRCRKVNLVTNVVAKGDAAGALVSKCALHLVIPPPERSRLFDGAHANEFRD